jgi:ABC-2 type transport system ATP-binding protein
MKARDREVRMSQISVEHVVKEYNVIKKKPGLRGAFASLFAPNKSKVKAVDDISFEIQTGEIVGYIGPNGAGKSTTIKMLTGILYPTSGTIHINGLSPQANRTAVVKDLGVVFGQRTQLFWDLRLSESFELLKRVYRVDDRTYQANLKELSDLLQIGQFIDIPVRQLSLGQRMRGELAAAMLHSPSILFLDEPTIGLDIFAKHAVRDFILDINRRRNVTVILTTHDLVDVAELCSRLIVINHGKVVVDGALNDIITRIAPFRVLMLDLETPVSDIGNSKAQIIKTENNRIWCKFNQNEITASELISDLSSRLPIIDLSVKEPDIEDAIKEIYHQ